MNFYAEEEEKTLLKKLSSVTIVFQAEITVMIAFVPEIEGFANL